MLDTFRATYCIHIAGESRFRSAVCWFPIPQHTSQSWSLERIQVSSLRRSDRLFLRHFSNCKGHGSEIQGIPFPPSASKAIGLCPMQWAHVPDAPVMTTKGIESTVTLLHFPRRRLEEPRLCWGHWGGSEWESMLSCLRTGSGASSATWISYGTPGKWPAFSEYSSRLLICLLLKMVKKVTHQADI